MSLRSLFGRDLSSKLTYWNRHYRQNSFYRFNARTIHCGIIESDRKDEFSVYASAYCSEAHGVSLENEFRFYKAGNFRSLSRAEAHLQEEVYRAAQKHPETRFIREEGDVRSTGVKYVYSAGAWLPLKYFLYRSYFNGNTVFAITNEYASDLLPPDYKNWTFLGQIPANANFVTRRTDREIGDTHNCFWIEPGILEVSGFAE